MSPNLSECVGDSFCYTIRNIADVKELRITRPWTLASGSLCVRLESVDRFTLQSAASLLFGEEDMVSLDLDLRDTSHGVAYDAEDLFLPCGRRGCAYGQHLRKLVLRFHELEVGQLLPGLCAWGQGLTHLTLAGTVVADDGDLFPPPDDDESCYPLRCLVHLGLTLRCEQFLYQNDSWLTAVLPPSLRSMDVRVLDDPHLYVPLLQTVGRRCPRLHTLGLTIVAALESPLAVLVPTIETGKCIVPVTVRHLRCSFEWVAAGALLDDQRVTPSMAFVLEQVALSSSLITLCVRVNGRGPSM